MWDGPPLEKPGEAGMEGMDDGMEGVLECSMYNPTAVSRLPPDISRYDVARDLSSVPVTDRNWVIKSSEIVDDIFLILLFLALGRGMCSEEDEEE